MCRESKCGAGLRTKSIAVVTNELKGQEVILTNQPAFTDDYVNDGVKIGLLSQCRLHYSIEIGV